MRLLERLFASTRDPRDAVRPLWRHIVEQAREPEWYRDGGVADTLEGRFDMVTLVLALVMLRMERSESLAVHAGPLTELFVEEMDGQLRQSGVGDLMVGKQIGRLMSALGGRISALRSALPATDEALADVVRRNVTLREDAALHLIVGRVRSLAHRLDATGEPELLAGEIA